VLQSLFTGVLRATLRAATGIFAVQRFFEALMANKGNIQYQGRRVDEGVGHESRNA
jgi:hypothetical protein